MVGIHEYTCTKGINPIDIKYFQFFKKRSKDRVKDINFRSAKKMRSDLDKSIDSLAPCSEGLELNVDMTESVKSIKSSKPKSIPTKPSSAELEEFYKSLSECKVKPVCLSLEKPYADSFILKTRNIGSVSDLFDPKLMDFKLHRPT